jgi:hypothetical protein
MRSESGWRTEFLRTSSVFHRNLVALTIVKNTAHDSRSEMLRQNFGLMGSSRRNLMSSDTLSSTQVLTSISRLGSFRRNPHVGRLEDRFKQGGILEYVVRTIDPDQIFWYGREQGALVQRPVDEDGLYRSTVFPGLWLEPAALLNGDTRQLRTIVDLGCATPGHSGSRALLASRRCQS